MRHDTFPLALGPFAGDRGIFLVNDETGRVIGLIDKQYDAENIIALTARVAELEAALEQCLLHVDKMRTLSGGEGDIAAMNARAALAKKVTP